MLYLFLSYEFLFYLILFKSISSKANLIRFLHLFWITRIYGWSLHFSIALKVMLLTLFTTWSKFEYWSIPIFFTIFPKKVVGSSYRKMISCAAHQFQYWNLLKVLFCRMLKNVSLMFYWPHQGVYLLTFYESYVNNLSTTYCYANSVLHKSSLLEIYIYCN